MRVSFVPQRSLLLSILLLVLACALALISYSRGDYAAAALSVASMVPFAGWAAAKGALPRGIQKGKGET